MAEADEFAVDTPVAPRRVVYGHLRNELTELGGGGGPAW